MTREELCSRAAHLFVKANRMHRAYCDKLVGKSGLHRNQHKILMMLSCNKGRPSQKEIAERLEISTAAVAVVIKKLEKNGYILKRSSEGDGRFNEIEITPKGRVVVEETKEFFAECDQILFAGISEEELKRLEEEFARIGENLAEAMKEEQT